MNIINVKPTTSAFANGFDYFCSDCGIFFSAKIMQEEKEAVRHCPQCGEVHRCLASINSLLEYCVDKDIDPVNFYHAFPAYEPIPQSCTGVTPLQVEMIIGIIRELRRNKLPVTIEGIAGPSEYHQSKITKVFEKLHLTETGGN